MAYVRVSSKQAVVPALSFNVEGIGRACGQKRYADCNEHVSPFCASMNTQRAVDIAA
ncbi:hypothetical protein [Rhizobium sp. S163]|uniref:hypothetical protein n=1 Tax=Rhizobium sp. S163 TaxID=3055039 RepID=UPI0025A96C15|nr:hypothetical protein [Rhizobium sp. S163]MDM9649229.1 hypothetical protein [Rhizobium sp. S163]